MTDHGSLDDPVAKLNRAKVHCHQLRTEATDGGAYRHCPVTTEPQPSGLEYLIRASGIPPVNVAWPMVFGDALFNLRASLDHLVY